jgi:hypothetical protein
VAALLTLAIYGAGLPVFFDALRTVCDGSPCLDQQLAPADLRLLEELGISARLYAAGVTALTAMAATVWFTIGALIFWRKSGDPPALFAALFLTTFLPSDIPNTLKTALPAWSPAIGFVGFLGLMMLTLFFYVFPDGRFVPRWTRLLALVWFAVWAPGYVLGPETPLDSDSWPPVVIYVILVLWLGSGIGAQVYRYRRVSSPPQRQQTKWAVAGLVTGLTSYLVVVSPALFISPSQPLGMIGVLGDIVGDLCLLLIPLSIGVAVMRARLYDIDRLISRTLLYSALSATLLAVYVGSVLLLQGLFRAFLGQGSDLAIVVATLTIAALFQPLRRRFQALIDLRFDRRAYDAAQALAAFSARAREEVELATLTRDLVRVIDETVQPTHVALWLRPRRPDPGAPAPGGAASADAASPPQRTPSPSP